MESKNNIEFTEEEKTLANYAIVFSQPARIAILKYLASKPSVNL